LVNRGMNPDYSFAATAALSPGGSPLHAAPMFRGVAASPDYS